MEGETTYFLAFLRELSELGHISRVEQDLCELLISNTSIEIKDTNSGTDLVYDTLK